MTSTTSNTNTITVASTRSVIPFRHAMAALAVSVAALIAMPVVLADRLSDKDVKALFERIYQERDRFEDQLDGTMKRSILRGPQGEVNVERYLDDLQENVNKMKDRFSDDYSASAEVTTVLRQGTEMQRFMATQAPDLDGASEWKRLESSLLALAAAYGTKLPLAEGQQARRMNDREVRNAADELAKNADKFKQELDASLSNDTTVDKAARDAAVQEADGLKKDAERISSAVGDGDPALGEAQSLFDRAARIRLASASRTLSPAAKTAWSSVETGLDLVAQGFGMPAR